MPAWGGKALGKTIWMKKETGSVAIRKSCKNKIGIFKPTFSLHNINTCLTRSMKREIGAESTWTRSSKPSTRGFPSARAVW
jgi:hypothetical protein